jgi:hypothetical protein
VLSTALSAIAVSALSASAASAQEPAAGEFSLVSAMHGKCITVPPSQTAPRVFMRGCAGSSHGSNQRWTYDPVTGELKTPWNQCLDASGDDLFGVLNVRVRSCTGSSNQKWDMDGDRIMLRTIIGPGDERLCATIGNGDRDDGTVLVVTYCNRAENQVFRRDPSGVGGSTVSIQSNLTSPDPDPACVDVPIRERGAFPGLQAWLWDCQGPGHTNQRFKRTAERELKAMATVGSAREFCLDGGSGQDGSPVTIQVCNRGTSQQWNLVATGELKGINGLCLHAPGQSNANGNLLSLNRCNGASRGQLWSYRDLR